MSTIGGALRSVIVADGAVSGRVFRDRAPDSPTFPYITFLDPISLVPGMTGDGVVLTRERQVQVDLWQKTREESDPLLARVVSLVDDADLDTGDGRKVFRTRMTSLQRVEDPDPGIVHHALTLTVRHRGV